MEAPVLHSRAYTALENPQQHNRKYSQYEHLKLPVMFKLVLDRFDKPYFSWDLEGTRSVNVSELHVHEVRDVASFFKPHLKVTNHASSSFSRDLTADRDDTILAFLSLILLVIIEGFVTTLLLRTRTKGQQLWIRSQASLRTDSCGYSARIQKTKAKGVAVKKTKRCFDRSCDCRSGTYGWD